MLLFNVEVLFSLVTNASILIIYNKKKSYAKETIPQESLEIQLGLAI